MFCSALRDRQSKWPRVITLDYEVEKHFTIRFERKVGLFVEGKVGIGKLEIHIYTLYVYICVNDRGAKYHGLSLMNNDLNWRRFSPWWLTYLMLNNRRDVYPSCKSFFNFFFRLWRADFFEYLNVLFSSSERIVEKFDLIVRELWRNFFLFTQLRSLECNVHGFLNTREKRTLYFLLFVFSIMYAAATITVTTRGDVYPFAGTPRYLTNALFKLGFKLSLLSWKTRRFIS